MTRRKRTLGVLWIGVLGLAAAWTPTTATAQTIVVTARSLKDLAGDFEYLLKAAAPAGMDVQQVTGLVKQVQSGELVKGLDADRGFGVAITLPKDFPAGEPPTIVVAIPVTDLGQFLDSIKNFGITVDDKPGVEGFSHKVSGPNDNPTLFVVQSRGYALFTPIPDGAEKLKEVDPASWKAKGRPQALLSARVQIAEIPEGLKEQVLAQAEAQLQQQGERKPNEDEAEFKGRMAGQQLVMDGFKSLVRDGDAIALEIDLDRKAGELAVDLSFSGKPGTGVAKSLRSLAGRRSRFEDLVKDGSMAFWATFPMAKELRDGIAQGLDSAMTSELAGLSSPEKKKLYTRLAELLKKNLGAPDLDYGVAFGRAATAGGKAPHFSLIFGMKVQDGREFEKLVRDALEQEKPEKGMKVEFGVAKAADGTAIHRLSGPIDEKDPKDARIAEAFGKGMSLGFAFRDDAILAVLGEDSTGQLKMALDALASPRPAADGPGVPIAAIIRVADLGALADTEKDREDFRRVAEQTFAGENAKKDRLALVVKGEGDGLHLRLSLDVPVLKLLASVGHRMQMAK